MIQHKFKKFFNNINLDLLFNTKSILIISSWFLITTFLFFSLDTYQNWTIFWLIVFSFYWLKTNRIVLDVFKPPSEIILLFLFVLVSLDIIVISNYIDQSKNLIISFIHSVMLSFEVLLIGLLLIINSQKSSKSQTIKQRVLIWYGIIGYLAHTVVFYDHIYFLYGFQIILFIFLLKKSVWLEDLSKTDLYIYAGIVLVLFLLLPSDIDLRYLSLKQVNPSIFWISIPFYFYLILKMFLLVTLVKVPIVMIYNHASLSRKLSIAGLFQSSFPQIIQFLVLIFTFYFFISSWQADQLRDIILKEFKSSYQEENNTSPVKYKFQKNTNIISIDGYEKHEIESNLYGYEVVTLRKLEYQTKKSPFPNDYFIYFNSADTTEKHFHLIKIDTTFIKNITEKLSVVVLSGIKAYPFELKPWEETIYNIQYWQSQEEINIFPFSIFSNNYGQTIESEIWTYDQPDSSIIIDSDIYPKMNRNLVLGRLYFKILNAENVNSYYAIDIYFAPHYSFFSSFIAKIILLLIILSFLFNVFITRRVIKFGEEIRSIIIKKFNSLKTGIREISSGNLNYKVKLEGEDEFVEFANHFNQMGDKLKQTIADQRKMDRLNHEFQIARNVQLGLLPAKLPKIKGYNIAASFETAIEVGGDFYDILQLEKNKYLFTIGDVSGKGASAAFYMAQFISLLRYSIQFTKKPEEIAERLNKYFISHVTDRQIFITAVIGVLDVLRNKITLIRAGHNLPIFIPSDNQKKINELNIPGIGIGLSKTTFKKSLVVQQYTMNEGDKLLLFTDGIPEAARPGINDDMEIFGEQELFTLIDRSRNLSANNLANNINNELTRFYGKHSRVDDHTTLIIEKI